MVEKCWIIYVKGIDKSIIYDLVENFFCNKRKSGGGDVEKVDYYLEDGYCIVYFENLLGKVIMCLFILLFFFRLVWEILKVFERGDRFGIFLYFNFKNGRSYYYVFNKFKFFLVKIIY